MKRVIAYIDGYNLYYGLLKGTPYKWLDLVSFAKWFLRPDQEIVGIKYFTAPTKTYPHDGDAVDRQKVYLQALSSMPLITIVQGFYAKNKTLAPVVEKPGDRGAPRDHERRPRRGGLLRNLDARRRSGA